MTIALVPSPVLTGQDDPDHDAETLDWPEKQRQAGYGGSQRQTAQPKDRRLAQREKEARA